MNPTACHINALLANTNSDNNFNLSTIGKLAPEVDKIIVNSGMTVNKALFIYYAAAEEKCEVYLLANIQRLFGRVTVECIVPGRELEMIEGAECLVIGGGSITRLVSKVAPYAEHIWRKVLSGVPFVGINAGSMFLSSAYIPIPSGICDNISFFPFQFVSGFSETPMGLNGIRNILNNQQQLLYALCMPVIEEGGGIVLEDATSGLAGTHTDQGSFPPGVTKELFIFERDGRGGIREVTWTPAQRKNLPINYF